MPPRCALQIFESVHPSSDDENAEGANLRPNTGMAGTTYRVRHGNSYNIMRIIRNAVTILISISRNFVGENLTPCESGECDAIKAEVVGRKSHPL
jgi:hypothetical protein